MPIRLLLAEDSATLCQAVVDLLRTDSNIAIAGQAETFAQTLEVVATRKPDILVLDSAYA